MSDDEVRELVRLLYYKCHGIFPTDEQAKHFVQNELKPMINQIQKGQNDVK